MKQFFDGDAVWGDCLRNMTRGRRKWTGTRAFVPAFKFDFSVMMEPEDADALAYILSRPKKTTEPRFLVCDCELELGTVYEPNDMSPFGPLIETESIDCFMRLLRSDSPAEDISWNYYIGYEWEDAVVPAAKLIPL